MTDLKSAKECANEVKQSIEKEVNGWIEEFNHRFPELKLTISVDGDRIFSKNKDDSHYVHTYVNIRT